MGGPPVYQHGSNEPSLDPAWQNLLDSNNTFKMTFRRLVSVKLIPVFCCVKGLRFPFDHIYLVNNWTADTIFEFVSVLFQAFAALCSERHLITLYTKRYRQLICLQSFCNCLHSSFLLFVAKNRQFYEFYEAKKLLFLGRDRCLKHLTQCRFIITNEF